MNNKLILNIVIVYFVILSIVLVFQISKKKDNISAPTTSNQVTSEDRLDNGRLPAHVLRRRAAFGAAHRGQGRGALPRPIR